MRNGIVRGDASVYIDVIPRLGARVRDVTMRELTDLYEERRVIEILVARCLSVPILDHTDCFAPAGGESA